MVLDDYRLVEICTQAAWYVLRYMQYNELNISETYGTVQFKFDIYMHVTCNFLDKFLVPLASYMWENH